MSFCNNIASVNSWKTDLKVVERNEGASVARGGEPSLAPKKLLLADHNQLNHLLAFTYTPSFHPVL